MKTTAAKITLLIASATAIAGMMSCTTFACRTGPPIDTVNVAKVVSDPYTQFIQYALWPDESTIVAKKCPIQELAPEIEKFTAVLHARLKTDCLPTSAQINQRAIGLTELHDGHDYLLLAYRTQKRISFQIQYGPALYILVNPISCSDFSETNTADLVRQTAASVLRIPGTATSLQVFVSSVNIGKSRCGDLGTQKERPDEAIPSVWHEDIRWWSDGKYVLFAVSQQTREDYAVLQNRSQMPPLTKHRFSYRRDTETNEDAQIAEPYK
jgi:hypothetical protein